jgi:DNA-binding FadR family transcriptional regulator
VSASKERWNELDAVVLLERTGKLVKELEATGARMPQSKRERYHARLVAAHDARDMAAYRIALKEYGEGAREAYRKAKGGRRRR